MVAQRQPGTPPIALARRGSLALVFLMVFYAAPTSTLVKVIRQRNSSSVHWPLCSMNVLSAGGRLLLVLLGREGLWRQDWGMLLVVLLLGREGMWRQDWGLL